MTIQVTTRMDPTIKAFLTRGVKAGVQAGIRKTLVESRRHVKALSAKELRTSGQINRSVKAKQVKEGINLTPRRQPSANSINPTTGQNASYIVDYSTSRMRLSAIPYKTKILTIKTKGKGKRGKRKVHQIYTNVYNRGFALDSLKPFWLGVSPRKKPSPSSKPIAVRRKGVERKPLEPVTAPSMSEMFQHTQLGGKISKIESKYFEERFGKNISYILNRV